MKRSMCFGIVGFGYFLYWISITKVFNAKFKIKLILKSRNVINGVNVIKRNKIYNNSISPFQYKVYLARPSPPT